MNKENVGTNHLNNRILLFVCNRKVIYYYYITLPSITITITITLGNFQSITITITITGKSGYYYYNYILHITITPSLVVVVVVGVGGGVSISVSISRRSTLSKTYMEETCKFCVLSLDLNSQRHLECYKVLTILRKIFQIRKTGVKYMTAVLS